MSAGFDLRNERMEMGAYMWTEYRADELDWCDLDLQQLMMQKLVKINVSVSSKLIYSRILASFVTCLCACQRSGIRIHNLFR